MKYFVKIILVYCIALSLVVPVDAQKQHSNKKKNNSSKQLIKNKETSQQTIAAQTVVALPPATSITLDTTKPDVVVLFSSFKPSLRNAAKINFTAATPLLDTATIELTYQVPAQNLFFTYQPVTIKPLSLYIDSAVQWYNNSYLKLGYGNFKTPFAEASISFGKAQKSITSILAKHISSTGKLPFQEFAKTDISITGLYAGKNNTEWNTSLFFNNSNQFLYGFMPSNISFDKNEIRQNFTTIGFKLGYQTKLPNAYGITYHPTVSFNYFFDAKNATETNAIIKLPINKSITKLLNLDLSVTADITNFQLPANFQFPAMTTKNNLFYINPSLQFNTPNFKLNVGVQPTIDNQTNLLLPNISAESKLGKEKFVLLAGWIGSVQKNNYQKLSATNAWLAQSISLFNTQQNEIYLGLKNSLGNHFTYHTQLSLLKFKQQPLFVNDNFDGKTFNIIYDDNLQMLKFHIEVGYAVQEKFSFLAAANYNQITKTTYQKAFGILPLEITGTLKWQIIKDIFFNADIFFWDGAHYLTQSNQTQKLSPAIDASTGIEYRIAKRLNIWLQMNNVLNNTYQRWNQYQVLGFNVLGGVVYSFNK